MTFSWSEHKSIHKLPCSVCGMTYENTVGRLDAWLCPGPSINATVNRIIEHLAGPPWHHSFDEGEREEVVKLWSSWLAGLVRAQK